MKKFISIALLLALCVSLFAGCNQEPAETTSDLDNAIDYLFNMYKSSSKNEDIKITSDKEIISIVKIGGVDYNVNWTVAVTSGDQNAVSITDGSAANMKKIDLADVRESETKFTLTAEVKDADGNAKTVSFNYVTPEAKPVEVAAGEVTIFFPTDNVYVTGVQYDYTSSSGSVKAELVLSEKKSDAIIFVMDEKDGKVTFATKDGKYLFCDGTNVQLASEQGEFTVFTIEAAEGGNFIKSNAFYNGNPEKPQYLEVYNGYLTCYGMNAEKANIYTFTLDTAEGAGTTTPETGKTEEPTEPVITEAQLPEITEVAAETAYKFGVIQVKLDKTLYVTGEVDGRYLVTTDKLADAADVYVEQAEGGYKFYIVKDGANLYFDVYNNEDGKVSLQYGAEGDVFTFNAECSNWVTNLDGTDFYIGAYNEFSTLSASKTSYINADNAGIEQFPGGFFSATAPEALAQVTAPAVDTAYKFGMLQGNLGTTLYITGNTANKDYYLETTEDPAAAMDVYLETVEGGYHLYFTKDGVKTYIDVYQNGDYVNIRLTDAPSAVLVWNEEYKTFTANIGGEDYYLGTYKEYNTLSASKFSYISTSFPAVLYQG